MGAWVLSYACDELHNLSGLTTEDQFERNELRPWIYEKETDPRDARLLVNAEQVCRARVHLESLDQVYGSVNIEVWACKSRRRGK